MKTALIILLIALAGLVAPTHTTADTTITLPLYRWHYLGFDDQYACHYIGHGYWQSVRQTGGCEPHLIVTV